MKNKRPKLLSIIAIFTILGGIIGVILSLPLFGLFHSIEQKGLTVKAKVNILEVQPNTPAAKAQLKVGDEVISVNNEIIDTPSDFVELVDANRGKEVSIEIERDQQSLSVALAPRINPPPGEGSVGVVLTGVKIKKVPLYQLVPQVIIRSYLGYEEAPALFFSSYIYQDKSYYRLRSLIVNIIWVIVGVGLWKLKKWALYGFLFLTAYGLLISLPYFLNPENYQSNRPQSLFFSYLNKPTLTDTLICMGGEVMQIFMIVYIFSKRKLLE